MAAWQRAGFAWDRTTHPRGWDASPTNCARAAQLPWYGTRNQKNPEPGGGQWPKRGISTHQRRQHWVIRAEAPSTYRRRHQITEDQSTSEDVQSKFIRSLYVNGGRGSVNEEKRRCADRGLVAAGLLLPHVSSRIGRKQSTDRSPDRRSCRRTQTHGEHGERQRRQVRDVQVTTRVPNGRRECSAR